jgi:hypothetical protein
LGYPALRVGSFLWPVWGLLLFFSLLASPKSAQALEAGEGHVGSSYYSTQFRTFGQQFSISEYYAYLDFQQKLTNYGILDGKLAYSYLREPPGTFQAGSGWNQAYGRLSLKDYHWGRGVLAA